MTVTDSSSTAYPRPDTDSLERLVTVALGLIDEGDAQGFEELCRRHPGHAKDLRGAIGRLEESGLIEQAPWGPTTIPDRLGEFLLLEQVGGGGMGVVYAALQEPLGRKVALKILKPEHQFFEGSHRRFQREVEAVARLAHPGIVGIYTVGESEQLPYFAMEFVHGHSLAQALRGLAGRSPESLMGEDLLHSQGMGSTGRMEGGWVHTVLRIVHEVAGALAHAHARGVLHRDVKPSNIMITPDGHARLLDFGLASFAEATKLTSSGAQPGSLPYMAPEQVMGRAETVGPSTDVYGLGVTLYELLTLRMPFTGKDVHQLSVEIARGMPTSPKRYHSQLPADLLTVCAKAMDVDPARRYASAQDFAEDLGNMLAFRPIRARRAALPVRLLRKARRHPTGALAAALAGVVLVGGPAGYLIQDAKSRAQLEGVNEDLKGALAAADQRLDRAREVVELSSKVAREMLHEPSNEAARTLLREGTMDYYLAALDEDVLNPYLTQDGIQARKLLARDRRFDGDYVGAEEPLRDGLALLENLPRDARESWHESSRISVLWALAPTLLAQGKTVEALKHYRDLLSAAEGVAAKNPAGRKERGRLASAYWAMAQYYGFVGDAAAYEAELLRTAALEAEFLADSPGDPRLEVSLCNSRNAIAIHLREQGRLKEAATVLEDTGERVRRLMQVDSQHGYTATEFFRYLCERGLVHALQGEYEQAKPYFEEALLSTRDRLSGELWNVNLRGICLTYWCLIGDSYLAAGQTQQAADLCEEALGWLPDYLRAGPLLPKFQMVAARLWSLRARIDRELGAIEEARNSCQRALVHARRSAQLVPELERFEVEVHHLTELQMELAGEKE